MYYQNYLPILNNCIPTIYLSIFLSIHPSIWQGHISLLSSTTDRYVRARRTSARSRFRAVAAVSHGSDATGRSNLPVRHALDRLPRVGTNVICFQLRRGARSRSFRTSWQVALRWSNAAADLWGARSARGRGREERQVMENCNCGLGIAPVPRERRARHTQSFPRCR